MVNLAALRPALAAAATLVALAFAAGPAAAQGGCVRGNCWGAVAIGPNGANSYAVNHPDSASAIVAARSSGSCGGGRCTHWYSFQNSCGAAVIGQGRVGWGRAATKEAAQTRAMQECVAATTGCVLRVWACTSR